MVSTDLLGEGAGGIYYTSMWPIIMPQFLPPRRSRVLLALELLLRFCATNVTGAAALHPWSPATMSPCNPADTSQQFDQEEQQQAGGAGVVVIIRDRETHSRCLAVKDCIFKVQGLHGWVGGDVVLDSCSSPCSHWTVVPDPAFLTSGKSVYYLAESATPENPYFSLNNVGTPPGMGVGPPLSPWDPLVQSFVTAYGLNVIAQTLNNQWSFDKVTGLIKVTASVDFSAMTVCKDHADDCCLAATPCDWPCSQLSAGCESNPVTPSRSFRQLSSACGFCVSRLKH
jgi:hypothetical protein